MDFNIYMDYLTFKTRKALLDHYTKHGKDIQAKNPEEYERLANQVIRKGFLEPAKRGAVRIFNPYTKEHVILDPSIQKLLTYYVRNATVC
jgi:hypothetical protein